MLLFWKKVTKKPKVLTLPLRAGDILLHRILSYANYISSARIFISFDHTQSPPICI